MSAVDVLAAFDMCIECFGAAEECPDDTACIEEIREARAATAELIEAAKWAERDEYTRPACVRLRAALARVGGA